MHTEYQKNNRGSILLSALLAVALFSIISSGVIGVLFVANEGTVRSGEYMQASVYATEAVSALRLLKQEDFSSLTLGDYVLLYDNQGWSLQSSGDTTGDEFVREVTISKPSANILEIEIAIVWNTLRDKNRSFTLETRLSNWEEEVSGGPPGQGNGNGNGPPGQGNGNGPPGGGPPGQGNGNGPPGGGPPGQGNGNGPPGNGPPGRGGG